MCWAQSLDDPSAEPDLGNRFQVPGVLQQRLLVLFDSFAQIVHLGTIIYYQCLRFDSSHSVM